MVQTLDGKSSCGADRQKGSCSGGTLNGPHQLHEVDERKYYAGRYMGLRGEEIEVTHLFA